MSEAMQMANITRVGIGFDVHRLVEGRALIIAGVRVEFSLGLLGHSDGDVVLHAVADAIAGAAGLADIGEQFPDTLQATEGMDSRIIVETMLGQAHEKGLGVVNLDVVIQAESPQLSPYKEKMRVSLAGMLQVDQQVVNLKARTAEGMGEIGKGQAMACTAIVGMGQVKKGTKGQRDRGTEEYREETETPGKTWG